MVTHVQRACCKSIFYSTQYWNCFHWKNLCASIRLYVTWSLNVPKKNQYQLDLTPPIDHMNLWNGHGNQIKNPTQFHIYLIAGKRYLSLLQVNISLRDEQTHSNLVNLRSFVLLLKLGTTHFEWVHEFYILFSFIIQRLKKQQGANDFFLRPRNDVCYSKKSPLNLKYSHKSLAEITTRIPGMFWNF